MDIQKTAQKKQKAIDAILSELGKKLKAYREENGLTLPKLGQQGGVSWLLISNIEKGETRNIELKKLVQIANSIGYTIELSVIYVQ